MPYIGNTVQNQGFTPAIDYFNGNGVTVTFTLSRPIASVAQVIVAVDNVIQNPSSAFGVVGNSITFTSAPLSGTNNIWVEYTSLITTYQGISQDPTVIGDIRATGGYLAEGDFGNSFVDGAILDYVTGAGRVTVGELDDLIFYHGGTAGRSEMMKVSYAGNSTLAGGLAATGNITTTGNVGIGTTSPSTKLEVVKAGNSSGGTMMLTGSKTNNSTKYGYVTGAHYTSDTYPQGVGIIGCTSVSGGNIVSIGGDLNEVIAATSIKFWTAANATTAAGTERMQISASGYVTMPAQPVFSAYIGTGATTSVGVSATQKIPCTAVVNISGSFNNSTYRFTAPVTGSYQFNTNVEINASASGRWGISFFKNGSVYVSDIEYYDAPGAQWQNASMSCVIPLNVGDYVELYTESVPSGASVWYSPNPSGNGNFSGYLIG